MGRGSTSSTTESPGREGPSDARLGLIVLHGPGPAFAGRRIVVDGELVFGRGLAVLGPEARHDKTLSREHVRITAKGQTLVVRDLGSHNGTLVNGQPVKLAQMVEGDVLQAGGFLLIARPLSLGAPAASEPKVLDGCSAAIHRVGRDLVEARASSSPVLLWGPPGVGKQHAVRAVLGERSHSRIDLVRPPSELALVEDAVILERLDEADAATQAKLVGASRDWRERAWVVALSSRDPLALEREGKLRSDLLNVFREYIVEIPSLEARREDIPFLAARAVDDVHALDVTVMSALVLAEAWPGNASGVLACLRTARRASAGRLEIADLALPSAARPPTLAAARDGSWFQMGNRARTSLVGRPVLARLLAALLSAREARPSEVVEVATLVSATWPGDKVLPKAAISRVYVAVSTLRKLGLGAALEHVGDGYRLDPRNDLSLVD